MTPRLKNYLNCLKWTTSASSSTYKKVHFTVHLHSIKKIHMKICKLFCIFPYHLLGLQNPQLRNVSRTLANNLPTLFNMYEPK